MRDTVIHDPVAAYDRIAVCGPGGEVQCTFDATGRRIWLPTINRRQDAQCGHPKGLSARLERLGNLQRLARSFR
jgi:hypothetical protein